MCKKMGLLTMILIPIIAIGALISKKTFRKCEKRYCEVEREKRAD